MQANIRPLRGDALRYIETSIKKFDIIFADPPYDMPDFASVPVKILESQMLRPGTIVIVEHNRKHDFSKLPHFVDHREYGSVNFSIFRIPDSENT